jgi:DNA-binding transcriptional regulator YdaS (Cro superfamily)
MVDERGHGAASELARRLGMSPANVSRWITGKAEVPLGRWIDVAIALNEADPLRLVRATDWVAGFPGYLEQLEQMSPDEAAASWRANFGTRDDRRSPLVERLPDVDRLAVLERRLAIVEQLLGIGLDDVETDEVIARFRSSLRGVEAVESSDDDR